ncbi:MAG: hypothetical protein JXQ29_06990 [Planctomycetes bacterium]|nr:hypothetical protein [Planctomycetota bacterium]
MIDPPSPRGKRPGARPETNAGKLLKPPRGADPTLGRSAIRAARVVRLLPLWLLGLLAAVVAVPLFSGPFLLGHDGGFHLYNTCEYGDALAHGVVVAHRTPNFYGGLGGINFKYYAPYAYLPASLLWLAGMPAYRALAAVAALTFWLSGLGLYAWARLFLPRRAALISACAYLLASYHLQELYFRFAYAELWGFALAPWLFWAVTRALRATSLRPCLGAALLLAVLGLAHNLTAFMLAPFLFGYGLLLGRGSARAFGRLALVFVLAGALGAFYALPAFCDRGDVLMSRQFRETTSYRHAALAISDLGRAPRAASPWKPTIDGGLLVLGGLGALVALRRRSRPATAGLPPRVAGGALGLGLCALMLATSWGAWAADVVPLLRYVQFPWRFSLVASLFLAFLAGVTVLAPRHGRAGVWLACVVMAVTVGLVWLGLERSGPADLTDHPGTRAAYVRSLRAVLWSNDVESKYLPVWAADAVARRRASSVRPEPPLPHRAVELRDHHTWIAFTVVPPEPAWTVVLPRLYVPGWTAEHAGGDIAIQPDPDTGLMRIVGRNVGPDVTLVYRGTLAYRAGRILSWAAALFVLLAAATSLLRRSRT